MKSISALLFFLAIFLFEKASSSDDCSNHDMCKGSSNSFRTCSCNKDCYKFGDCCSDVIIEPEHQKQHQQFQCQRDRYSPAVYAKKKCLDDFNYHIGSKHACEVLLSDRADVLGNILVTSIKTKTTYWNIHCAYCNNENPDNLKPWNTQILCPSKHDNRTFSVSYIKEHVTYNTEIDEWGLNVDNGFVVCTLEFQKPSSITPKYLHYCPPNLVSTCPLDFLDNDVIGKCSMFHAERRQIDTDVYFKNVHCAKCNGVPEEELECVERKIGGPVSNKKLKDVTKVVFYGTWIEREGPMICMSGNSWDPLTARCRPFPEELLEAMKMTSVSANAGTTVTGISMFVVFVFMYIQRYFDYGFKDL